MAASSHLPEDSREALSFAGLVVLTLGAFDWGLEGAIIIPALPDLGKHYDASLIATAWLATAYVLVSVVAAPILSRLGDIYGKRRLLLIALAGFAVGSLICAVASSIELAIAGRAVQGVGAAAGPLTLAIARDTVPPRQLPTVVGAVLGAIFLGTGIGFILGGALVDLFSPAAIFWFLFLFALAVVLVIPRFVRESPLRTKVALDPAGIMLLGAGLVALLLAISKAPSWGWTSASIVGLFAGSALLLALFVLVEHRVRQPHVDLRFLSTRPFANANVCAFAYGVVSLIATYVTPQIAAAPAASGYGLALSTTQIGLLLLPSCLAGLLSAFVAGRAIDRIGPRGLVATGFVLLIAGNLMLALAHSSTLEFAASLAVIGLSWGLVATVLYTLVLRAASADKSAIAVSVTSLFRSVGVSVGVTAAFVVIAASGFDGEFRAESGYRNALLLGAAASFCALLASLTLPSRRASTRRLAVADAAPG